MVGQFYSRNIRKEERKIFSIITLLYFLGQYNKHYNIYKCFGWTNLYIGLIPPPLNLSNVLHAFSSFIVHTKTLMYMNGHEITSMKKGIILNDIHRH